MTEEQYRLRKKYNVTHTDGTPTDPKAIYFVLRIDGPSMMAYASRVALRLYAQTLPIDQEQFAKDIFELLADLHFGRENERIKTP